MRAFAIFGILIGTATCLLSLLVPEDLSTTDAVVLMGMATALLLNGVVFGLYELVIATREGNDRA